MSRYIDAEWLLNFFEPYPNDYQTPLGSLRACVDDAPSIDIVFCEDCRECVEKGVGVDCPSGYGYLYCRRKKSVVNEGDYCSWGEREGE